MWVSHRSGCRWILVLSHWEELRCRRLPRLSTFWGEGICITWCGGMRRLELRNYGCSWPRGGVKFPTVDGGRFSAVADPSPTVGLSPVPVKGSGSVQILVRPLLRTVPSRDREGTASPWLCLSWTAYRAHSVRPYCASPLFTSAIRVAPLAKALLAAAASPRSMALVDRSPALTACNACR